ncbi:hypothetical protein AB0H82_35775 [Streptomyces sp. NPDC050732]|uniref:hypothetical protein n=1 Tax=Streptomyces sp. NPDC050732 TaxID=3154632 RepID=UPI0034475C0D
MKYDILQILGAVLTVAFGQGAIRLLMDHDNSGLLGWLPGGFTVLIIVYVALTAVGVLLAGRSHARAKELGRRG